MAEGTIEAVHPGRLQRGGDGAHLRLRVGPGGRRGYEAPFPFNGTIDRAVVAATGPVVRDPVAEVAAILASQ